MLGPAEVNIVTRDRPGEASFSAPACFPSRPMLRLSLLVLSLLAAEALLAKGGLRAATRLRALLPAESSADGEMPLRSVQLLRRRVASAALALGPMAVALSRVLAEEVEDKSPTDFGAFRVPYNHENLPLREFLGKKATLVVNIKLDDPQTVAQFPALREIFDKYADAGLGVLVFPTEQVSTPRYCGWVLITAGLLRARRRRDGSGQGQGVLRLRQVPQGSRLRQGRPPGTLRSPALQRTYEYSSHAQRLRPGHFELREVPA